MLTWKELGAEGAEKKLRQISISAKENKKSVQNPDLYNLKKYRAKQDD